MNKLAALPIRLKSHKENQVHGDSYPYTPYDYEVLLRKWPVEPHLHYLAAFSGPLIDDCDVDIGSLLLQQFYQWSKQLAVIAGHSEEKGIRGVKSIFLSPVCCVAKYRDKHAPLPDDEQLAEFLAFIVPVTNNGSRVASLYPTDNSRFPQFYCLGDILKGMYSTTIDVHPATREMLALLHKWLSDQHHVPYFLDELFQLPCEKRVMAVSRNQLHYNREQTLTLTDQYYQAVQDYANTPVDKQAVNPYYGTDVKLSDKPDILLVNRYYGMGKPDYEAIGTSLSEWVATVENTDGTDWVSKYPLHKAACENDIAGIRRLFKRGCYPDQLDDDGWSPLHYACWYGELEAVKVFVEECLSSIEIENSSGSTPLHFAAGKGNDKVVEYLLKVNANPSALDNEGRSPLAVCLECKENEWKTTEQLLRQAYKEQVLSKPYRTTSSLPASPTNNETLDNGTATTFEYGHTLPLINESSEDIEPLRMPQGSLGDILEEGSIITTATTTKKQSLSMTKVSIHYLNGFSGLAQFHRGTNTLAIDALREACALVDLRLDFQFIFALSIASKSLSIQLGDSDKPLRLLERWPRLLNKFSTGKSAEVAVIQMKRNVFFPVIREKNITDPKALEFLYYDAKANVLNGTYTCDEEEAITLASIAVQLELGDYNPSIHVPGYLSLEAFVPSYHMTKKNQVYLERQVLASYSHLAQEDRTTFALYQKYLEICWQWPFYGSTFYSAVMSVKGWKRTDSSSLLPPISSGRKHTPVMIGVNAMGFHIIHESNHVHLQSYSIDELQWDMSKEKNLFGLFTKDKKRRITFSTKQAVLLHSLATEMHKEIQTYRDLSKHKKRVQHRVRTKS